MSAFLGQDVDLTVVVVDNGSRSEHRSWLRRRLPTEVELLELGANTGFGPAANRGFEHLLAQAAPAPFLAVAPHDALPEDGCVGRILAELDRHPDAGLVCADVGDGHRPVFDRYLGGITLPSGVAEGWESVDYPHGTLMVARRTCLLDVGLFDERYFAYCEEADLGLRARRAGWDVGLVHGARVHNPTMRSGSLAVDYLMQRNTIQLVRRHSGRYPAGMRFAIGVLELARGALGWGPPQFLYAPRARLWALVDVLRRRHGPPPARYFEGVGDSVASAR